MAKGLRKAFTLIEVMVSVIIITLVIGALYSMRSGSTFLMQQNLEKTKVQNVQTFLLSQENYGFLKEEVTLDKLIEGFTLEDDLRRELKNKKISLNYIPTDAIDSNATGLEIGRGMLRLEGVSTSFFRLQAL
jgi:prepilin-type N-terminal cleavage/methylation domain-containing protein